jgi:hypothetical protein
VPVTQVLGEITVRGMSTRLLTGNANLNLRGATGDDFVIGSTSGGSSFAMVVPGTYDLYYKMTTAGTGLPGNKLAKLRSGIVVSGPYVVPVDVDVPATTVTGTITVNGANAATKPGGYGKLALRNASGDEAALGTTNSLSQYTAVVVPGTYDVVYFGDQSEGTGVPRNQGAKLRSGIVVGSTPLTLDIDVPATPVSGLITVNGTPVPQESGIASAWLTNPAGEFFALSSTRGGPDAGGTTAGTYAKVVIPGTYDLYYRYQLSSGLPTAPMRLPPNQLAPLRTGIVIGSTPLTIDLDIPATTVTGTITMNGAPITQASGTGNLSLRNAAGDSAALATTATGTYSRLMMPGTYDVYYSAVPAGTSIPIAGIPTNTLVKLRSGVVVGASPLTLNIDIATTTVTGTIKVNGAQVPQASGTGNLLLRNAAGDSALLATTAVVGAYSQQVVAGTYDLYYVAVSGGNDVTASRVPFNSGARLRTGIVVGSTPLVLDIDVPSATVSGTLSQNGVLYPGGGSGGSGILFIQNAIGDRVNISATAFGTYSRNAIPGTYDLYYSVTTSSIGVPSNTMARLGCFNVP